MLEWNILENELKLYRDLCSSIRQVLFQYEKECAELIAQIKLLSFEESQTTFDQLFDLQQKLAVVLYKYEFSLNNRLKNFVYHFDRDDSYSRSYWYNKITSGLLWPDE